MRRHRESPGRALTTGKVQFSRGGGYLLGRHIDSHGKSYKARKGTQPEGNLLWRRYRHRKGIKEFLRRALTTGKVQFPRAGGNLLGRHRESHWESYKARKGTQPEGNLLWGRYRQRKGIKGFLWRALTTGKVQFPQREKIC